MANWVYYPQSSLVRNSTLTDLVGTSTTKLLMLNGRRNSYAVADTPSGIEWSFKLDVGSGNTLNPNFLAFLNVVQASTATIGFDILTGSTDNGTTWDQHLTIDGITDPAINYLGALGTGYGAKRYFKFKMTPIATNDKWGVMYMGTKIAPSVDCNYGEPIEYDETGTKVKETDGGGVFGVNKFAVKRIWNVNYESISTADKTLLVSLRTACVGPLYPFIFTDTDGNILFGRLNSNIQVTETGAGLWNVRFSIREEI